RRLVVSAWVMALYPMILLSALYAAWFIAWHALGHPPRPSLDDPKFISPLVDKACDAAGIVMMGTFLSLLACILLTAVMFGRSWFAKDNPQSRVDLSPIFILLTWFAGIGIILVEPSRVLEWHFD